MRRKVERSLALRVLKTKGWEEPKTFPIFSLEAASVKRCKTTQHQCIGGILFRRWAFAHHAFFNRSVAPL